jgi:hypothetical protein
MPDFRRPEPTFETVHESIWVAANQYEGEGVRGAFTTKELADAWASGQDSVEVVEIFLERQSLRPIYGGGTLIENLWAEMDSIMERLMTGQEAEDGGDRFRAEELAWVLAIVTNAYDPSIDRIRKETMDRWNALQDQDVDPAAGSLGGVAQ